MNMYVYPVSDGEEVSIEIMGVDGRHSPLEALEIARRVLNSALANLSPLTNQAGRETGSDSLRVVCKAVANNLETLGQVSFATMELLIAANAPREEDKK